MGDPVHRPDASSQPPTREQGSFSATLLELKRRGCCVLISGDVNERVRATQSRRLFGRSEEPRQRVLTLTDATPSFATAYLPEGIDPAHSSVTTLDYTEDVRSITNSAPQPSSVASDSEPSMGCLGTLLYDPIRDAVRIDEPDPGELRLGIATLGGVIDADGFPAARVFLRELRQQLLAVHGMGHFHYPGALVAETMDALAPLIDIHIELRQPNSVPEHRWHLLETDDSTEWLPM